MRNENEAKIEICVRRYKQIYGKTPNAVIMKENELAKELMVEGLITSPQGVRNINSTDELKTEHGTCVIYYTHEKENTIPILEKQITFARKGLLKKLKDPKTFNMAMTIAGLTKAI